MQGEVKLQGGATVQAELVEITTFSDPAREGPPIFQLIEGDPTAAPVIAFWAAMQEKMAPGDEKRKEVADAARKVAQDHEDRIRDGNVAAVTAAGLIFRTLVGKDRGMLEIAWHGVAQSILLLNYLEKHGLLENESSILAERVIADAERLRMMQGIADKPDEMLTEFHKALAEGKQFDTGRENVARLGTIAAADPRVVTVALAYVLSDGSSKTAVSSWPSQFYAQNMAIACGKILALLYRNSDMSGPPKTEMPAEPGQSEEPAPKENV